MWDELAYGALGAVILADVRRLDDCFPSVNYFETLRLPFVVAVNCFDDSPMLRPGGGAGTRSTSTPTSRWCCATPATSRRSSSVLITLVETIAALAFGPGRAPPAQRDDAGAGRRFGH